MSKVIGYTIVGISLGMVIAGGKMGFEHLALMLLGSGIVQIEHNREEERQERRKRLIKRMERKMGR